MIKMARTFLSRHSWAPLVAASLIFLSCYCIQAVKVMAQLPLWEDEVLSVWAAQYPSPVQINWALAHGLQASPPAFSVMLHYVGALAGWSNLAMRLPAFIAELLSSILTFLLLRRYIGAPAAAFAACLTLESLSYFGLQARPYSLMVLFFVVALICWDNLNRRQSFWWTAGLCAALMAGISIHFYSVYFIPCFALIELNQLRLTKKLRLGVWTALVVAGLSIFLWSSVLRPWNHYVAGEVSASHAYGRKPTIYSLFMTYLYLLLGSGGLPQGSIGTIGTATVILLMAVCLLGAALAYESLRWKPLEMRQTTQSAKSHDRGFEQIFLGTLSVPLVIFICSVLGPKTYHLRYSLAGAVGVSALLATTLNGFPAFRRLVPLLLLLTSALTLAIGVPTFLYFDHTKIYDAMPGTEPIVVADGSQFIQLLYSSPQQFRSRIVYLWLPKEVPVEDAVNAHTIKRVLHSYRCLLRIRQSS